MSTFEVTTENILINGKPKKIISGSIHYFRIPSIYWKDRLLKAKECGLNCIETYVPWNIHEETEGQFDFESQKDLGKFLDLAKELGLYAIVRPGPYICSEWDFGAFPWWLLKYENIKLRCSEKTFLDKMTPFFKQVCQILKPRTIRHGGNVIFVQIENEYGCYGSDKVYLNYIKSLFDNSGMEVDYITSDNDSEFLQKRGGVDGVLHSVNYRCDSERCIGVLKKYCPNQIGAVMELWTGRAEHFCEERKSRDLDEVAKSVKTALENAELVNAYMFCGGTNFGFLNGSLDFGGNLIVQRTTYDTEAPINEYGQRTKKYYAIQKEIYKYLGKEIPKSKCVDVKLKNYGEAAFVAKCSLNDVIDEIGFKRKFPYLPNMEETDYGFGYLIYKTKVFIGNKGGNLIFPQIHDVAHLYVNGEYKKSFYRNNADNTYHIEDRGDYDIEIVIENLGRINFGSNLKDHKGLIGEIIIEDFELHMKGFAMDFDVISVPLIKLPNLKDNKTILNKPSFYKYKINIEEVEDTLLQVKGFTRGVAFINEFNLGRHWTHEFNDNLLYIPKNLLKKGVNEIIIFDVLENDNKKSVSLVDKL